MTCELSALLIQPTLTVKGLKQRKDLGLRAVIGAGVGSGIHRPAESPPTSCTEHFQRRVSCPLGILYSSHCNQHHHAIVTAEPFASGVLFGSLSFKLSASLNEHIGSLQGPV